MSMRNKQKLMTFGPTFGNIQSPCAYEVRRMQMFVGFNTCLNTWHLPRVLSCHLLDLQCQTRRPQQLQETNTHRGILRVKTWTMNAHNLSVLCLYEKHKSQNESGARTCLQAWTWVAPLSQIRDSVSATGRLMNYTLQSSHGRALKWLPGGFPTQTKKLNWLSHGRLFMPNESK